MKPRFVLIILPENTDQIELRNYLFRHSKYGIIYFKTPKRPVAFSICYL